MSRAKKLLSNPYFDKLVETVSTYLDTFQRKLTPQDDWVESVKRAVFVQVDPIFRKVFGRVIVRRKGKRDYICSTIDATPDDVEVALDESGAARNLISTRKYRMLDEGTVQEWAVGSYRFVYGEDDEWQQHVYLFPGQNDYETAIYGHKEPNYEVDAKGHISEPQTHGDPDRKVRDALDEAGIEYEQNPDW